MGWLDSHGGDGWDLLTPDQQNMILDEEDQMEKVYVYNGRSVNKVAELQQDDHEWLQMAAERNFETHIYFYKEA